jgi:hypothetical protein
VRVTLQLIVADELGPKTSKSLGVAITALATGIGVLAAGPLGGGVAALVVSPATAWANEPKTVHKALVKAAKPINTSEVKLGGRDNAVKVQFGGNGQAWFLRQEPRLEAPWSPETTPP